jgi:tripartite-type tricarboxylate transporter receptor subunit TctC
MSLSRLGMIVAFLVLLAVPNAARAQENFPNRPIRIVVPYSPGSVADVFARIIAQNMQEQWKGSIVVESKSGANGSIAAEEVMRAAPDGYTWLLVTTYFTASPALNTQLRWDPTRDFIPIGQICRAPNFFIVPASLPVKTVADYVALAKAKPGALNYSHPGKGSTGHLGFELFKRLAGIDVTGIGYRGYPQMVPDITSGLITSTFLSANQALAQVQTGSIRIIGAISDGRSKYFPEVPTLAEQGFADAQVTPWFGVVVCPRARRSRSSSASARRWKRRWPQATCARNSTSPAARRKARRSRSSAISSSPTSRSGPGWSRRPASPRTDSHWNSSCPALGRASTSCLL